MACWQMDYFEVKAFEIQQMRKEVFPDLPLYLTKRRNFQGMRPAINFLFRASFMTMKRTGSWCQDEPAKAGLSFHGFPPLVYLTIVCHPWEPKSLFLCFAASLQMYYSLLICYVSPNSNHPWSFSSLSFSAVMLVHVFTKFSSFFSSPVFVFHSNLWGLHKEFGRTEEFFHPYSFYIYLEFFC